jgi:plasmid stabilization system protein ParE
VAHIHQAACYTQRAETLRAQRVKGDLEGAARLGVERQLLSGRRLVPPGQPQEIFRRTLDDQTVLGVVLDQNRDTPPLEIEWYLVDLPLARHVERMGGENRLIERALHAALEPAVDISV